MARLKISMTMGMRPIMRMMMVERIQPMMNAAREGVGGGETVVMGILLIWTGALEGIERSLSW
jgi:hypothetical protein